MPFHETAHAEEGPRLSPSKARFRLEAPRASFETPLRQAQQLLRMSGWDLTFGSDALTARGGDVRAWDTHRERTIGPDRDEIRRHLDGRDRAHPPGRADRPAPAGRPGRAAPRSRS